MPNLTDKPLVDVNKLTQSNIDPNINQPSADIVTDTSSPYLGMLKKAVPTSSTNAALQTTTPTTITPVETPKETTNTITSSPATATTSDYLQQIQDAQSKLLSDTEARIAQEQASREATLRSQYGVKKEQLKKEQEQGTATQAALEYKLGRKDTLFGQGEMQELAQKQSMAMQDLEAKEQEAIDAMKDAVRTNNYKQYQLAKDAYDTAFNQRISVQQEARAQASADLDKIYKTQQIQKMQQEVVQANADTYAAGMLSFDPTTGEVVMPSDEDLMTFSEQSGIPLASLKNSARTKAYELSKMSAEDRQRELNIEKAKQDLLPDIVNEYQQMKELGYTKAADPLSYLREKKDAESSKTIGTGGLGGVGETALDTAQVADTTSQSILAQTGLSIQAFNYLTQGTASMTRMSEATRKQIMEEAQNFLNTKGLDVSTFQSRYKAYNDTLQKNIQRFNNTVIMEGELKGTIENLSEAADEASFGKMRYANVAKMFAGQEFNDQNVQKYMVHLNQLKSELAGYNAAVQGKTSADVTDLNEAERVIKNGISTGSLKGFENALTSSVEKMGKTLQGSVDRSNKQVWDLFGVGENYTPQGITKPKNASDFWAGATPQQKSDYNALRTKWPNKTPQEVYDIYLQANK